MKKIINKTKLSLAAIWATILSLPIKVLGQLQFDRQSMYWPLPPAEPTAEPKINIVMKIVQRTLVWITLVVWIVNLVKIKKIDDKAQKKKRIKKAIIVISILVIILIISFLIPALLLKN